MKFELNFLFWSRTFTWAALSIGTAAESYRGTESTESALCNSNPPLHCGIFSLRPPWTASFRRNPAIQQNPTRKRGSFFRLIFLFLIESPFLVTGLHRARASTRWISRCRARYRESFSGLHAETRRGTRPSRVGAQRPVRLGGGSDSGRSPWRGRHEGLAATHRKPPKPYHQMLIF